MDVNRLMARIATAKSGDTIDIDPGSYRLPSQVEVPAGVSLAGDPRGVEIIGSLELLGDLPRTLSGLHMVPR